MHPRCWWGTEAHNGAVGGCTRNLLRYGVAHGILPHFGIKSPLMAHILVFFCLTGLSEGRKPRHKDGYLFLFSRQMCCGRLLVVVGDIKRSAECSLLLGSTNITDYVRTKSHEAVIYQVPILDYSWSLSSEASEYSALTSFHLDSTQKLCQGNACVAIDDLEVEA